MPRPQGFNQTPGDRNLVILGFLKKRGQLWSNLNQIATGVVGSGLNRQRTREILDDFVKLTLVETRESQDPQSRYEFRITPKGLAKYRTLVNFINDPETKFILGFRQQEYE